MFSGIDQLGDGLRGFQIGDRVADMTLVGSNAAYRTLRADRLARVPAGLDAAEAATAYGSRGGRCPKHFAVERPLDDDRGLLGHCKRSSNSVGAAFSVGGRRMEASAIAIMSAAIVVVVAVAWHGRGRWY